MDILLLLHYLASKAHHRLEINELVTDQPCPIKEAFLTNNATKLKNLLGNTANLADRDEVVQIRF